MTILIYFFFFFVMTNTKIYFVTAVINLNTQFYLRTKNKFQITIYNYTLILNYVYLINEQEKWYLSTLMGWQENIKFQIQL